MKFNENPDAIEDRKDFDSPIYGDSDSVTFALFNNFIIYGLNPTITHGDLYVYIYILLVPSWIQELDKDWSYFYDLKKKIKHEGKLTDDEKNKITSLDIYNIDRTPLLGKLPQVIQGRLWTDSRMISFWNDLVYIASRKNDIIEFIKLLKGDPTQYKYEVKDKLYDYEQFLSGSYNDNLEFDPKQIHTLSPDKKGDVLKSMGFEPKKPVPLQFKQMIQGESFKNWLKENL